MSQSVYSKRFFTQAGLGGRGASVVVPSGHVYIVKQITMYASPLLGLLTCFFEDEPSGAALVIGDATITSPMEQLFYGGLVFGPGTGFHFQVDSGFAETADVSASGYDLITP